MSDEERDDLKAISRPEQFKALGHPMRLRLLIALGQDQATISQLAATLGSNKGNIAHHLKVLADAGLVEPAESRTTRGGTERYYRRAFRNLTIVGGATADIALRALADEIATARPEPFLMLRTLRLTPEYAEKLVASLRDLGDQAQAEYAPGQPRYGLVLGFYQPADAPAPAEPGAGNRAGSSQGAGRRRPPRVASKPKSPSD